MRARHASVTSDALTSRAWIRSATSVSDRWVSASLMRKHGEALNDEAHSYMNFVVNGARRMQSLVSDLLDYSRLSEEVDTLVYGG